jgi:hypothetical protein
MLSPLLCGDSLFQHSMLEIHEQKASATLSCIKVPTAGD